LKRLTLEKTKAHNDLDQMFLAIQKDKFLEISRDIIANIPEKIMEENIKTH
jgi:hypothetical protein